MRVPLLFGGEANKFTEACLREYALRPDPRYPTAAFAAQRRVARLDGGGGVGGLRTGTP
ncbi:hypothetical protein [Streptomyces sp. NPDC101150]|uniref:hypothetical protein n=1 Tax=Streptomyces sp. NPDC101150 TaxID=3366114 RepID=UPI003803F8B0